MNLKQLAAEKAVEFVESDTVVGLGTGSTAYWAIQKLGQRVREGLRIRAIATSTRSEELARELNIPIITFDEVQTIDLTIDGADEVDAQLNLTKGGGGALLREKLVASASKKLIIVVDESKVVTHLGRFPLPVEVIPFGWKVSAQAVEKLGCRAQLRMADNAPYRTDNGNYIIDCHFGTIENPGELTTRLNLIPGVVENGLFVEMASQVVVAHQDGAIRVLSR